MPRARKFFDTVVAFFATLAGCGVSAEEDNYVQQVLQEGEDGIDQMTIPMIVITPPDADPVLWVEHAIARANAPASRIPIPNGGFTSARRARQVLQEVFDGMERVVAEAAVLAQEGMEQTMAEVRQTLVVVQEQQVIQQEMIASTIAGIIESMRDNSDGSEEGEEGNISSE